jgi:hypothetical protein
MDWVRAAWYTFMMGTGLADPYRNEQYLPKWDFVYNMERKGVAINFQNPDKGRVALNLVTALADDLGTLIDMVGE